MASTPQLIEEPLPARGISDITSSKMPAGFGVDVHDMVLDQETTLRPRAGWEANGSIADVATAVGWEVPVGYLYDNSRTDFDAVPQILLSYVEWDSAWTGLNPSTGPNGVHTLSWGYVYDSSSDIGSTKLPDGTATRRSLPVGKPVSIEGNWYGSSLGEFTRLDRQSTSTSDASAIVMWAGSVGAVASNTITISNGSKTGTLGTNIGADAYNNFYAIVSNGLAGHRYAYRIVDSGGTDITLAEPYGLGDNTTDVPSASGSTVAIHPIGYMPSAPRSTALAPWRGRLFCAGRLDDAIIPGSSDGFFKSALSWSSASNIQYWPRTNYLVLDTGESIVALQALGELMLIWTENQTWMLTGYDEDSFQVVQLSATVGCVGRAASTVHKGVIFWMARDGVYYLNGTTPTKLSEPPAPSGHYRNFSFYAVELRTFGTFPWLESHNDNLILACDRVVPDSGRSGTSSPSYPRPLNYIIHVPSNSWCSWGRTDPAEQGHNPGLFFTAVRLAADVQPDLVGANVPQLSGASRYGVYNLEWIWDHSYQAGRLQTPIYQDELYTGSGDTITLSDVPASFTTRDFIVAEGQTVRLQDVQVEHSCQDTSSAAACWAVTLDTDQDIITTSLTVGDVSSRFALPVTNAIPGERYYTDRFTDVSFPTEGMVWRFRFVFNPSATTISGKLNALRLKFTSKPTFMGRVDNTA